MSQTVKQQFTKWLDERYLDTISYTYLKMMDAAEEFAQANGLTELSIYDFAVPEYFKTLSTDILQLLARTNITDENFLRMRGTFDRFQEYIEGDGKIPDEQVALLIERYDEDDQIRYEKFKAREEERKRREQEKEKMLELFTKVSEEKEKEQSPEELEPAESTEAAGEEEISEEGSEKSSIAAEEDERNTEKPKEIVLYEGDESEEEEAGEISFEEESLITDLEEIDNAIDFETFSEEDEEELTVVNPQIVPEVSFAAEEEIFTSEEEDLVAQALIETDEASNELQFDSFIDQLDEEELEELSGDYPDEDERTEEREEDLNERSPIVEEESVSFKSDEQASFDDRDEPVVEEVEQKDDDLLEDTDLQILDEIRKQEVISANDVAYEDMTSGSSVPSPPTTQSEIVDTLTSADDEFEAFVKILNKREFPARQEQESFDELTDQIAQIDASADASVQDFFTSLDEEQSVPEAERTETFSKLDSLLFDDPDEEEDPNDPFTKPDAQEICKADEEEPAPAILVEDEEIVEETNSAQTQSVSDEADQLSEAEEASYVLIDDLLFEELDEWTISKEEEKAQDEKEESVGIEPSEIEENNASPLNEGETRSDELIDAYLFEELDEMENTVEEIEPPVEELIKELVVPTATGLPIEGELPDFGIEAILEESYEEVDAKMAEELFSLFATEIKEPKGWGYIPYKTGSVISLGKTPTLEESSAIELATTMSSQTEEDTTETDLMSQQTDALIDTLLFDELASPVDDDAEYEEEMPTPPEDAEIISLNGAIDLDGTIALDGVVSTMLLEDKKSGETLLNQPVEDIAIEAKVTEDLPKSIEAVLPVIPEEKKEEIFQTLGSLKYLVPTPTSFAIGKREKIEVRDWRDLYVKLINALIPLDREKITALLEYNTTEESLKRPRMLSNGLIIETELSTRTILKNIHAILTLCSIDVDSIRLTLDT